LPPLGLDTLNRLQRIRFEPAETKRQQFLQDFDGFPRAASVTIGLAQLVGRK
jgi:hypothetical protein